MKMKKCNNCFKVKKIHAKGRCGNCNFKIRHQTEPKFFLSTKYTAIKQRCENPSNIGFNKYKNKLKCNREEFIKKFINDFKFLDLYKKWQESNFNINLRSSIDRIINTKDYEIDNLQFITMLENSKKDQINKPVLVYDKYNNLITKFNSINEASISLNLQRSNIFKVLNGLRNHTGGYVFKYQ